LAKQSIELRYKLLPYNYTLAFENSTQGAPLMRPLFFEEPANKALRTNAATYLWGPDILVTPVIRSGLKTVEVYFPNTANWFNFYTDELITGGQTKSISTKENSIPTYIRTGAFIPMAKSLQTTADYKGNDIVLHYYHDASVKESKGKLYHDDGLTANAFEKGQYELLQFTSQADKKCLEFEFVAETGINYASNNKEVLMVIHNITNKPKRLKIEKSRRDFVWDKTTETLSFPLKWNTKNTKNVTIKF
jgi:alpha-glucosidase (family GH31 glycosyl hydrolase)